MSWFKEKVEDWDLVGKSMRAAEGRDVVRDVAVRKFNPDHVTIDEEGNVIEVAEPQDSTETIEFDEPPVIEVRSTGIQVDLGLDKETLKTIRGD